ncbi:NAD(P)-binding protein [Roridomyces roridus]|uniref:NAD(P)-binding protein n=1 Tax=Roridomyces roridus TaxID=1738132 RepID=A0AAD7BZQ8_9AGAR|nr:NAD(P)-binding protein [Roridomyces roridus]
MSSKTQFFLTGVTGYIGGTVLARFLGHPNAASFHFTLLVRDPNKAAKFNEIPGVTAVVGSLNDIQLVTKLASEADIVVGVADADDLVATEATLAGLKQRYATTGAPPIFIHTSGAGLFIDDAKGMHAKATIYNDSDADQIAALPPTRMHRNVDLAIVAGDAAGYTKTYIVIPTMVYGIATGQFVEKGLQNPHSQVFPGLIKVSIARGRAGMVGEGKNLWPNVEVHELADLYIALYDSITSTPSTGHGVNGYYFGVNDEHSFYDLTKAVGEALVALGKSEDSEPTTFSQAELDKYFGGSTLLGANVRCRASHSLSIGWKPTKGTKYLLESVKPEMEALLAKH